MRWVVLVELLAGRCTELSLRELDSGRVTESGEGIDNIEEDSQILLLGVPFGDRRSVNHQGCISGQHPNSLLQLGIHMDAHPSLISGQAAPGRLG